MSFELGLAIIGGLGGAYGAIQSWMTQRKMKQVEAERFSTRLDIAFDHSITSTPEHKLLHGTVTFENKGETNIKIIRLNIDGRDRSSEFAMSYIPDNHKSNPQFDPLPDQLTSIDIVALNNYKQVGFSNSKSAFKITQPDLIYAREKEPKLREVENVKGNIDNYIKDKIDQIHSVLKNKSKTNIEQELGDLLFVKIINKELRGLQLFPGVILGQEFLVEYQGTGVLYLNVETSTIRILHDTINYLETYKELAARINKTQKIDNDLAEQLSNIIRKIVTPESYAIHKQKETFLVHLP